MSQVAKELGDVLLRLGVLTPEQLSLALQEEERTGHSAWKFLMERGRLTERDLVKARAIQVGMPFVDVRDERPEPAAVEVVPYPIATNQVALPMRIENGKLVVAMAEPTDHLGLAQLEEAAGMPVAVAVAYRGDLFEAIELAYRAHKGSRSFDMLGFKNGNGPGAPRPPMGSLSADDLPVVEAAAPAPTVEEEEVKAEKEPRLAEFLEAVIAQGASDLHLTAGVPPMLRVHGELRALPGYRRLLPKDLQEMVYSILTQKQRETFEENLELDLSYQLPGKGRFRVNVFQQRDALGAVMRMIPFGIKTLDELGLPDAVHEFAQMRRGLVLVTGVTGSGKSTTLAGLLDIVNSERREHIMTVEDPIEFLHRHKKSVVNQREVGADTHSFSQALKHVLRQDPDVILVGEMRDLETISTALTAAETGHLVFGTLHTQSAPSTIDRIVDVFPPQGQEQIRIMIANSLQAVVTQALLPTADGAGRVAALEILLPDDAVRNLIRQAKIEQVYSVMQTKTAGGMQTMEQALADLVFGEMISQETALGATNRPDQLIGLLERTGVQLGETEPPGAGLRLAGS
jgi:twitching motility protein PilT